MKTLTYVVRDGQGVELGRSEQLRMALEMRRMAGDDSYLDMVWL